MNILLIFTFFIISGAVRCIDVIGYSGGSVLVDSMKLWHTGYIQHLYKRYKDGWDILIFNENYNKGINEGRFTLYRNNDGNLMIFIRDVNTQDSGTYQIGVYGQWFTNMTLKVKEDSCCGASQRVMVNTGQTVTFICQYSQDYKNDEKMIFKEGKDSIERIYNKWKKKERFSISDYKYNNHFSVRITDVRSEDAGVYLCGVWLNEIFYSYSILTAVHLHIMISDSSVLIIIIVCVCVILLLIGGITLIIVYKLRHNKTPDSRSGQFNSTAQLPTILSSSDDVLYAAVSFHKHEDSVSDGSVVFSKDEILTDYTTVSHH